MSLRPPAVPLVTHDPYFSIWSPADRLTDVPTTHWTGKPNPLRSPCVDGRAYRLMGTDPQDIPALPQTSVRVLPTRTIYEFGDDRIKLTLTFLTPALAADLEILARPVTYLIWEARSTAGRPHSVQLYFDCGVELVVDRSEQGVVGEMPAWSGLTALKMGSQDQPMLVRKGDDLRIDWGYLYVAAPTGKETRMAIVEGSTARAHFVEMGLLAGSEGIRPPVAPLSRSSVLAVHFDLGQVDVTPVVRRLMLAYDDVVSIQYFKSQLRPYWRRGGRTPGELLQVAEREYPELAVRSRKFDDDLMADLARVGGERYALLSALAYRQTLAGNKLAVDDRGRPCSFPRRTSATAASARWTCSFPRRPFSWYSARL